MSTSPESSDSEWISQAEAARLRGVSREAIRKLILKGRFRTLEIAGRTLVNKNDVHAGFLGSANVISGIEALKSQFNRVEAKDQKRFVEWVRERFPIHPLESEFGVPAEVILEAIARAPDISRRGIRGLITEAAFKVDVIDAIESLEDITPLGNHSFDFLLRYGSIDVSIQVKMQRKKAGRPMLASEAYRRFEDSHYVVETQRTRGGTRVGSGASTRPYRYGEFDILAVSMEPSTGSWSQFRYTLANWLIPDEADSTCLLKFQPVALNPDEDWTDDLLQCLNWLVNAESKTIGGRRRPETGSN